MQNGVDEDTLSHECAGVQRKLEQIVAAIPGVTDGEVPDPIVSVSLVAVQLRAGMTVLTAQRLNAAHIDGPLAGVTALLQTALEREPNPAVRGLLQTALTHCKSAYQVKNRELQSAVLH